MRKIYLTFTVALAVLFSVTAQETLTIPEFDPDEIPVIDGTDDPIWDLAPSISITKDADSSIYTWIGYEDPTGTDDYDNTTKIGYDDEGLYLFLEVTDDKITEDDSTILADTVNASGQYDYYRSFDADRLEVFIYDPVDTNKNQFIFWPNDIMYAAGKNPEIPTLKDFYRSNGVFGDSLQVEIVKTPTAYNMEVFIHWGLIHDADGQGIDISNADKIWVDFAITDNDNDADELGKIPGSPRYMAFWSSDTRPEGGSYTFAERNLGVVTLGDMVSDIEGAEIVNNGITLYPNPANQSVNIKGQADYVVISNIVGQAVAQIDVVNRSIQLNGMETGVYFVNIYNNNTLVDTQKLIIKK
jgi:hypothetical protein